MTGPNVEKNPFTEQLEMLLAFQTQMPGVGAGILDAKKIHALKSSNALFLTHYQAELARINPATFPFLNAQKKAALKRQLKNTLSVLLIEILTDAMDKRRYRLDALNKRFQLCESYLQQIEEIPKNDAPQTTLSPSTIPHNAAGNGPQKYLGIFLGKWLSEQLDSISKGKTVTLRNWLNDINNERLYWVWDGGLLKTVLEAIPADFHNNAGAQGVLNAPAEGLGYVSWIIYYTRFSINLSLLLKHSAPSWAPWLSKEEKQIPTWDRFKTQWAQRKFALLNDLAWASVNLICFFWLIGSEVKAYGGNALIMALLVFDILLTTWRFLEASTQYNRANKAFDEKIKALERQIDMENAWITEKEEKMKTSQKLDAEESKEKETKLRLVIQLLQERNELIKLQKKTQKDWRYQRFNLINNLVYSSGLICGWCLIGGVLFAPGGALAASQTAMLAMGLAGGAFVFVLMVAYQAISMGLEVAKMKSSVKENKEQINTLRAEFEAIRDEKPLQEEAGIDYGLCKGPPKSVVEKNKVYLEFFDLMPDDILYTIKDPKTGTVLTGTIDIHDIDSSITTTLTLDKLQPLTVKILEKIPQIHSHRDAARHERHETQRKYLFLEIKSLETHNRHEERMILFQRWKLLRATVIDALIPAVIFATLVLVSWPQHWL